MFCETEDNLTQECTLTRRKVEIFQARKTRTREIIRDMFDLQCQEASEILIARS